MKSLGHWGRSLLIYVALLSSGLGQHAGAQFVKTPWPKAKASSFLMYPVAKNQEGRLDSYDPDAFKYRISAKEIV